LEAAEGVNQTTET